MLSAWPPRLVERGGRTALVLRSPGNSPFSPGGFGELRKEAAGAARVWLVGPEKPRPPRCPNSISRGEGGPSEPRGQTGPGVYRHLRLNPPLLNLETHVCLLLPLSQLVAGILWSSVFFLTLLGAAGEDPGNTGTEQSYDRGLMYCTLSPTPLSATRWFLPFKLQGKNFASKQPPRGHK